MALIIWINGAFGFGKTQTVFELHRRQKPSYVYDPEKLGFALRSMNRRRSRRTIFKAIPMAGVQL